MQTLSKLAKLVSGEILGNQSTKISGVSEISSANEGDIVFVFDPKSIDQAFSSKASAVVVPSGQKIPQKKPTISVANPRLAMAQIAAVFASPCEVELGIHKTAVVSKTAKIGKNAKVGALVYIGPNVEIGDNATIYPNTSIYAKTKIGNNCIIHSGARLGVDGFGFVLVGGKFEKVPQVGILRIEDDVEIYANTCISRGALGETVIKRGTKIDSLTHVAHNCEIGEDCAITSLVGFAGSTKLGNHVSVGGQAGFSGHLEVGDNTVIMARAGITKNIPANSVVSGFPATDHRKDMEVQAILRRLPSILKKLKIK